MRGGFVTLTFLLSALEATNGMAMRFSSAPSGRCNVFGGEKLSASSSGGAAICSEIARAAAKSAPGVPYTAEIEVLSKSRLAAKLIVAGRALPEQHFAIIDSELNADAIQRFAASVADAIAAAAKAAQ